MIGRLDVYRHADAQLGEGPSWHAGLQALIWVDILRCDVHLSTSEDDRVYRTPEYVGAAVPLSDGALLLAMGGFATLDLDSGSTSTVARLPLEPGVRMNDGKCDPAGRFWAGSMELDGAPDRGALYRLDGPDAARCMVRPVTVSNGLGWSPDHEWMYYIDSPTKSVRRYAFDVAAGELGPSSVLVDTSAHPGVPDGMTVDAEGNLWVAFWDGAAVRCFSAAGELLDEVALPVRRPTSCAFGGPELRQLLVTTARDGLSADELRDQPLAGSVLALEPGPAGLPATPAVLDAPPVGTIRHREDET
jgi:sugar lactone lactonase YvrE